MEFCENTAGRNTPSDFNRGVGVGKSHLAIGCLNEILVKSNYSKKVLFVSYRELLEQLKFAMNDEEHESNYWCSNVRNQSSRRRSSR